MKVRQTSLDRLAFAGSIGTKSTGGCVKLIFNCLYKMHSEDDKLSSQVTYEIPFTYEDVYKNEKLAFHRVEGTDNVWIFIWDTDNALSSAMTYEVDENMNVLHETGNMPNSLAPYAAFEAVGRPKIVIYNDASFIDEEGKPTDKAHAVTYVEKIEAVRQWLLQHLTVVKNDLWYNCLYGLPLGQKNITKAMVDAEVLTIVTSNPDVLNVESFESDVEQHDYRLIMSVMTKYGLLDIDNTI